MSTILVLGISFRRWAHRLGAEQSETPVEVHPDALVEAEKVGETVRRISRHLPWYPTCLMQATAAKAMLNRRGIPSTLYLGVMTRSVEESLSMHAHAWLRTGPHILTGEHGHQQFRVVSTFGGQNG